jgi:GNAT superfamily N-acetyltransferase
MHRGHELWIPPLKIRENHFLDPRKNHHYRYSDAVCFIAYRNGTPAGRIMGIVNHRLNELWKNAHARFCNFESIDDQEVARALVSRAIDWAREKGMVRLVGPLGFSNQDPQGFLVEGFGERPSIGTVYNFDYIPRLIENEGFFKEVDYVTYKIVFPDTMPAIYTKISERVKNRARVQLIEFTTTREMKPYLEKVFHFMNQTYTDIYGFLPLSDDIIRSTARTYAEIVNPRLLKVVVDKDEEIVSFILGIQDITEGFRKAGGRLLPIGYFQIKSAQKRVKRLDLLLGGIKKEFRGIGLNTVMAIAMIASAQELGMEYADSHHELETNTAVQAEMKRLGGFIYKRHRVYKKDL